MKTSIINTLLLPGVDVEPIEAVATGEGVLVEVDASSVISKLRDDCHDT